jgi:DNA-binding NtrC family response regulator
MSLRKTVLVIDDDPAIRETLQMRLEAFGYRVLTLARGETAGEVCAQEQPDLLLLDLKLPGPDGLAVLQAVKAGFPEVEVIILTAQGTIEKAVSAIKVGAYDFLTKPVNSGRLEVMLEKALEKGAMFREVRSLRRHLRQLGRYGRMIGASAAMRRVYQLIEQVAGSDASVLIHGESGTGKELVARTIHELSRRRGGPFLALNCSAMTESLWESEIFGYERGAFTGANGLRQGCFEQAHGGTLFLDELAEMSLEIQPKFLRVLEDQTIRRLGGEKEVKVNVRLLAATNRELGATVRDGRLRHDLYYRLNVFAIQIPPLRERAEDIPLLVQHFIDELARRHDKRVKGVESAVIDELARRPWPGNVRELRNTIERALLVARDELIAPADLMTEGGAAPADPRSLRPPGSPVETGVLSSAGESLPVGATIETVERRLILKTLESVGGNKTRAARVLGISLKTLHNKVKRYFQNAT